jgi:hypothetical protein
MVGKSYMNAAARQGNIGNSGTLAAIGFLKELKACGGLDISRMCLGCRLRH